MELNPRQTQLIDTVRAEGDLLDVGRVGDHADRERCVARDLGREAGDRLEFHSM